MKVSFRLLIKIDKKNDGRLSVHSTAAVVVIRIFFISTIRVFACARNASYSWRRIKQQYRPSDVSWLKHTRYTKYKKMRQPRMLHAVHFFF